MQPKKWSKAQSNRVKPQSQTPLVEPLGPGWSHLAFCGKSFTLHGKKKFIRMAPPWGQWNRPWQGKTSGSRCDVKMSSGPSVKKPWIGFACTIKLKWNELQQLVGLVWHLTQTRRLNIPDLSGFRWISWQASKNCKWPAIREYWEYTIAIDRFKGSKIRSLQHACYLSARLGAWTDQHSSWRKGRPPWIFPSSQPVTGIMATCAPEFTLNSKLQCFKASMFWCPQPGPGTVVRCAWGKTMTLFSYGDPFRSRSLRMKMKPLWRNLRGGGMKPCLAHGRE